MALTKQYIIIIMDYLIHMFFKETISNMALIDRSRFTQNRAATRKITNF